MPSITADKAAFEVTGGVDTHQDTHTAAVIDLVGRVLGTQQFPATTAGYTALLAWMREFGQLLRIGVEGTGAYGAGLARRLRGEHVEVIEVDRPNASFLNWATIGHMALCARLCVVGRRRVEVVGSWPVWSLLVPLWTMTSGAGPETGLGAAPAEGLGDAGADRRIVVGGLGGAAERPAGGLFRAAGAGVDPPVQRRGAGRAR